MLITMTENKLCDLCGLDIEVTGFHLNTTEGAKHFCCEGCKGIYSLLNDDQILADAEPDKKDD